MTHYLSVGAAALKSFPKVTTETAGCREVRALCSTCLDVFCRLPGMTGRFLCGSNKPCQGAGPHSGDVQLGFDNSTLSVVSTS